MSLVLRDMAASEAEAVVEMVRGLARETGDRVTPQLTAAGLNASRDLVDFLVAADVDRLLGACLSLTTFSTWRGTRGMYVVDLFVDGAARNRNLGLALLREAARRSAARGGRFIKLEVDHTNLGAARFYQRLGFGRKDEDRLFVLESDRMQEFVAEKDSP